MPAWISIVVFALAVARVTRLVTADRVTEAPRRWLVVRLWGRTISDETVLNRFPMTTDCRGMARWMATERLDGKGVPPLGAYLLTCPWCVSIYIAAVAAPLCWHLGDNPWLFIPALACAFSQTSGLLAKIGE
jgi:hypothetical protein